MLDPKIYTLLKLEELGSYTHAAQALSLTQPAISHHIRMLEAVSYTHLDVYKRQGGERACFVKR